MITSTKNKEISRIRKLIRSSSQRAAEGVFIAEGKRFVSDIIKSDPNLIEKIYYSADDFDTKGLNAEAVADHVMQSVSDTSTPQGVLAVVKMPRYEKSRLLGERPLILILENIRDPGNMGTIFRSHEAAKGTGIILLGDCTDPFSPKCTRSTMGSIVRMPFIRCADICELGFLEEEGITVYAADLDGSDYDSMDYTKACAFIIGNEANGLTDVALSRAKGRIHIPMNKSPESLNAAVTAALLSFEAAAQRRRKRVWI